jgi:hypothetical protein
MSNRKDWLDVSHETLYDWINQTWAYLLLPGNMELMGISGANRIWVMNEFNVKRQKFVADFENWRNPSERTPVKNAALRDSEKEIRSAYRKLYMGLLKYSPSVTDADLIAMNFPSRIIKHTALNIFDLSIVANATSDSSGVVRIHFRDAGEPGKAKPKGVHCAEIVHALLPEPPGDWTELTVSSIALRSPLKLVFSDENRGKILYYAVRWENNRGEKGRWSEILSVRIS